MALFAKTMEGLGLTPPSPTTRFTRAEMALLMSIAATVGAVSLIPSTKFFTSLCAATGHETWVAILTGGFLLTIIGESLLWFQHLSLRYKLSQYKEGYMAKYFAAVFVLLASSLVKYSGENTAAGIWFFICCAVIFSSSILETLRPPSDLGLLGLFYSAAMTVAVAKYHTESPMVIGSYFMLCVFLYGCRYTLWATQSLVN